METLIGILAAILVVAFKVIEKKMNGASAHKPVVRPMEEVPSVTQIPRQELLAELLTKSEPVSEPEPTPVPVRQPVQQPVQQPQLRQQPELQPIQKPMTPPKKKVTEESDTKVRKEKIDPKKLVVYSEIMNRKY